MAISGIDSYANSLFQWQNQVLKNNSSSSSSSSTSNVSSLFSNSSMTSNVNSMIELVRYCMDQMGVSSDSRVTFTQITKYRNQVQSEFEKKLNQLIADSGISSTEGLTFSLDKDGTLTASGENANDVKKAQEWLNVNSTIGADLLAKLEDAGIELTDAVQFTLSASGKMTIIDRNSDVIQAAMDAVAKETEAAENLSAALQNLGIDSEIEFEFDDQGRLVVKGENENAEIINAWLEEQPELTNAVSKILQDNELDPMAATITLKSNGSLELDVANELEDIQAVFNTALTTGYKIYSGLNSIGIDPNISFSIQVNDDGSLTVISDHADRAKLQSIFDENSDLVKKYRQIETLASVDDARKALQISSTEMRKRIQIESMSSWWANSDNSNSYFGNYNNGSLSVLAGLNLSV